MVDLIKKTKELRRVFATTTEERQHARQQATTAFCNRLGMDFARMIPAITELEKALTRGTPLQGWRIVTEASFYNDHLEYSIDDNHQLSVYDNGTLVIQYPIQQNYQPYHGIGLAPDNVEVIEQAALEWLRKNLFRNVILCMRSITNDMIYLDDNNVIVTGEVGDKRIREIILRQP